MKRFVFLIISILFYQLISAQDQKLISLRGGTFTSSNSGIGLQLAFAKEIKENFYFSTSVGYFTFDDKVKLSINNLGPQRSQRIIKEALPFNFGVKYFFSRERFNPYLSFFWGLLKRNAEVYSIIEATDVTLRTIKSVADTHVSANIGFEFGTLFYLTEEFALDINITTTYGNIGQTIMFTGGLTYVL